MTTRQKTLVVAVLILGLVLRFHNYDVYPQRGATSDEYTYSFLGQSLLMKGVPISWSYFGAYKNRQDLTIDKLYFPIVWPYFDHPPLHGLLVASWAILWGETTFEQIQLSTIRLVPIVLTTISSLFLFALLRRHYDFGVALLGLLIYQTATIMVVSSRVVMAENLLTPILLGALLAYDRFRKKLTLGSAIILGTLSGLAVWTKELGIAVGMTIVLLCIYDKQKLVQIGVIILVTVAAILGYIAYGFSYDKEVFLAIVTTQATRMIGSETLWNLMSRPVLINKIFYDGWYLFGLLAIFFCFSGWKKHIRLLLPFFLYFVLLLGSLTREGEMGWYMIVVYPFMAAAAALVLAPAWKKPHGMVTVAVLFIGLSLFYYLIEVPFGITVTRFRLFLGVLFVPYLWGVVRSQEAITVRLQRVYIVLLLTVTAIFTYSYVHPS